MAQVSEEVEKADDTKKPEQPSLKLTEDIEKPTGIGSFGFADKKNSDKTENGEQGNEHKKSTNYFSQNIKPGEKLGFVFGGSAASSSNSSGFSAIKTHSSDSSTDIDSKDEKVEKQSTAVTEGFQKSASHEKLLEQASEYEKSHYNRQHFEEIDKFTGEEGEQHVLQVCCKIICFRNKCTVKRSYFDIRNPFVPLVVETFWKIFMNIYRHHVKL